MRQHMLLGALLVIVIFLVACQNSNDLSSDEQQTNNKEEIALNQSLIEAAAKGNQEKVEQLLQNGANIDATNDQGTTAVLAATYNNEVETVKLLIEEGADINKQDDRSDNVLLYAGAEGLLDILKLALEAGADTTLTNRFGGTALIPAAERGHVDVVKELLTNSDTDVNHINNLHWTALMEAIVLSDGGEKHQQIVQLLLEHGADFSITDKEGVTPLEHAKDRGFDKIIKLLEKAKA
ncbi:MULTISPECIES: ankyrin repeat domain-containing protein [Virgibacillus]|uniref:ankyrin repeat domain-containing protein n=1 Tax=Virgibacillus TaxID=84406 RepID=UPI000AA8480A|nr:MULTISPECIES: ankyrin repeat domain-containing protein [Virgibacillus]MEB5451175.1 ankyrin repeat domain-containing protein [Virgibacillus pantothenticus]MEB5455342.1 ankyrin repeat domain-containing protein [Virgibacillus pantothenticus]MEB5461504.1 ankyrin repeat domain-containing protein [Virgibacillus pantothenticus]MEB5463447.1 ankyrin repeat domain-containing protein [Virgibacillus pantothenticus]MEB5467838.1 ankyrin repeat domain-containing protein [Virgibacillus pantothenticus]